jgi:ComF family protein
MRLLHWITEQLTEAIWPSRCIGCHAFGSMLCRRCLKLIPFRSSHECLVCKRNSPGGIPCRQCQPHTDVDRLIVAGQAGHPLLTLAVHTFKYSSVRRLGGPLGAYLGNAIAKAAADTSFLDDPLFVPVPLHAKRLAQRGFNQSELLVRRIADYIGMAYRTDALIRTRHTASQVGRSSRWERLDNMARAFTARTETVANRDIVLVDDVCTTGATLDACAAALKKAGARTVVGVVLLRG